MGGLVIKRISVLCTPNAKDPTVTVSASAQLYEQLTIDCTYSARTVSLTRPINRDSIGSVNWALDSDASVDSFRHFIVGRSF